MRRARYGGYNQSMALWQIVCVGLVAVLLVFFGLIALVDPDAPGRSRRSLGAARIRRKRP